MSGTVYNANDSGQCTEEINLTDNVLCIMSLERLNNLLVITDSFQLHRFAAGADGKFALQNQVDINDHHKNLLHQQVYIGQIEYLFSHKEKAFCNLGRFCCFGYQFW
jgi:hypothetical protein